MKGNNRIGVRIFTGLALMCMAAFLLGPLAVRAEETTSISGADTQTTVSYTTVKARNKIYMLPSELRLLSLRNGNFIQFDTEDASIVSINGYGQMKALKAGTTRVSMLEGNTKTVYTVVVRDTVDIVIFAGQSNMAGAGGDSSAAPVPTKGTAYEYNLVSDDDRKLIPLQEPFGDGTNKSHIVNGKFVSGNGTLSSAFANAYYKQTGVPLVGVPAAWGGTTTRHWLKEGMLTTTNKRLTSCKKFLKKNKIKVRHIYVLWYQGESDAQYAISADTNIKNMKKIFKKFKKNGVEKMFIIKIAQQINFMGQNDYIQGAQEKLCKMNKNFIMATRIPASMHKDIGSWYSDVVHINQKGLNKIGKAAGKTMGKYAKKHSAKQK